MYFCKVLNAITRMFLDADANSGRKRWRNIAQGMAGLAGTGIAEIMTPTHIATIYASDCLGMPAARVSINGHRITKCSADGIVLEMEIRVEDDGRVHTLMVEAQAAFYSAHVVE